MTYKNIDNQPLESLRSGNERGIEEIYKKLYPKIRSYISQHDGNEEDAKEIFQKALLQLVLRAQSPDFSISSNFEGYFFTVCKNLWIREVKISKSRVTNDDQLHLISEEREIALGTLEQEKWELDRKRVE